MKSTGVRFAATCAFSLIEVALALGVTGFCLASVVALLPLGINSNQAAFSQTTAASIITHVLADLRATPASVPPSLTGTSAEYLIKIPADVAGGTSSTITTLYFGNSYQQFSFAPQLGTSRYRLTVTLPPPAGNRTATYVTLLVSWPAAPDPTLSTSALAGSVQVVGALNRN